MQRKKHSADKTGQRHNELQQEIEWIMQSKRDTLLCKKQGRKWERTLWSSRHTKGTLRLLDGKCVGDGRVGGC